MQPSVRPKQLGDLKTSMLLSRRMGTGEGMLKKRVSEHRALTVTITNWGPSQSAVALKLKMPALELKILCSPEDQVMVTRVSAVLTVTSALPSQMVLVAQLGAVSPETLTSGLGGSTRTNVSCTAGHPPTSSTETIYRPARSDGFTWELTPLSQL